MPATINPTGLYCAYLRKSRQDAELEALGHGETLQRHAQALAELAQRLGIRIVTTYREIVSGDTIADRPEIRRLLSDIDAGRWDGVLVMDIDRLGRGDSYDQGVIMRSFLYSGTIIITPDKIYDPADDSDSEFFEIKMFFARREYAMIKKRLQRGRIASVMDGCWIGTAIPYGYERYKLPDRRGYSLRPIADQADVVRAMFGWYADGLDGQEVGAAVIANKLNDMGLRTTRGGPWTACTVRKLLQNPVYVGAVRWNQRQQTHRIEDGRRVTSRPVSPNVIVAPGRHPPIVDQSLYDRVQAIFHAHEKRPKTLQAACANPLGGLVVCGQCGHRMQRKGDGRRCNDWLYCPTPRCPTHSAAISAVEDAILATLETWIGDLAPNATLDSPAPDPSTAATDAVRRQLTAQRDALSAQLSRHYDLLEQGVYTVDEFRSRRASIQSQLATLETQISRLNTTPSDPRSALAPKIRTVLATYRSTPDPASKNTLLRSVIDHITFNKPRRLYRDEPLGQSLVLDIYPKIPKK